MRRQIRSISLGIGLFLSAVSLTGCFAVLVGAAAGASGYAWAKGALVKEFNAPVSDLYEASMKSLEELGVAVASDEHDRVSARIRSSFSDGKKISINIDALTERSAKINIRVGVFGDKVRSELIYNAVRKYL